MNVITVASRKGGTGKSTLIAHLSAFVQQTGRRCFVIDADPQGSLTLSHILRAGNGFQVQGPERSIEPLLAHARKDGGRPTRCRTSSLAASVARAGPIG